MLIVQGKGMSSQLPPNVALLSVIQEILAVYLEVCHHTCILDTPDRFCGENARQVWVDSEAFPVPPAQGSPA